MESEHGNGKHRCPRRRQLRGWGRKRHDVMDTERDHCVGAQRRADQRPVGNSHQHPDKHPNEDANANPYAHADQHTHAHADADCNVNADQYTHAHADADRDAHADQHADSHSDADRDVYRDHYAHPHADSDADANPNRDTDQYAN